MEFKHNKLALNLMIIVLSMSISSCSLDDIFGSPSSTETPTEPAGNENNPPEPEPEPEPQPEPQPEPEPKDVVSTRITRALVLPSITPIADHVISGQLLNAAPTIEGLAVNEVIHWTKTYGPDDVSVDPETGRVTWTISPEMPSESFHIGLKASAINEMEHFSFIAHVDVTDVVTVGAGADYPTIKQGLANVTAGGTVVVLDGVYEGNDNYIGLTLPGALQHPPSGNENQYTTVMAKHPGQAVMQNGAMIRLRALNGYEPVSYVAIKGFYVVDGEIAAFGMGSSPEDNPNRHHHIKVINNGVQGGEDHSPFNAFRSDNILFENNYAFGGGRYKFTSYQAENIVMRRNVARYDRGTVPNEPKGTYSIYTTMDTRVNNNLAIDGDSPDFVTQGELAGEFTTPTTSGNTRAQFNRNVQLNSAFLFGNMDDQISGGGGDSDVEHRDIISWDVRPESRYVMTWGSAWFNHMTMGEINPRQFTDNFFNGYHNNSRGITNSILHELNNGDMFYSIQQQDEHETVGRTVPRYGADTLNITGFEGELQAQGTVNDVFNISEHDPIYRMENPTGALKYLTRIEEASALSQSGLDDTDIGATVLTFKGKSGTHFNEEGFDIETENPMWPFPMEHIIKEKFASYAYTGTTYTGHYTSRIESGTGSIVGARGFAVEGQSLTNYVWGYLGNLVPPMNVSAKVYDNSIVLQWAKAPQMMDDQIEGYRIYQFDNETQEMVLLIEVSYDQFVIVIDELQSETLYKLGVTAFNSDGNESGVAYPVSVMSPGS